ncbi:MAG: SUMF1/EgtB/PvdO family nonheme iron enzyme [Anaerolineae bacterium]|nr:SUMF1/EgtB/PvdO family nonheme iron enzyme [Anaerolineae bacterium]
MSDPQQESIQRLADLVGDEQCVLFLGNDLPLGPAGCAPPCRDEVAAELARDLGMAPSPPGSLGKVALLYEGQRGRHALVRRMLELLDHPTFQPTALHGQVAALPFRAILTTAQDRLLERALEAAGRAYATVMTDVEAPYVDEGKVMVYKLHGCTSRPASLVLTGKDQCLLEKRLSAYLSVLRYLFVTRPLLFLNYSLEDRLFETLFHEVAASVEAHRRRAYAAWPGASQEWRAIWAREELVLIDRPAGEVLDELARLVGRRERALVVEEAAAPLTKPPYKFLDPYESDDRDIFYGRQIESVRFFRLALSHKLTVLFGASGTGKTSLLKAGVIPMLWGQGYATVYVRALDDPLRAVRDEVVALLRRRGRAVADPGAVPLQGFFRAVLDPDDRLVVVLDQFEEFFLRLGDEVRRRFWGEVAAFRDRVPSPPAPLPIQGEGGEQGAEPEVRFVFSLREDFLGPLDEARVAIPELLGDSYRLTNLSDEKASTIITEPAARAGLVLAPDLVSSVLDDLREEGTIAPPQLQIVLDQLYRDCLANPDQVLAGAVPVLARERVTLEDYRERGGAEGILADYVNEALEKLPGDESRDLARALLKVMVTSKATKAALDRRALLAEMVQSGALETAGGVRAETALTVLARLVDLRLVREFERGGGTLYELAHDHVAAEIATWIDAAEMEAKLARELLRREVESWRSVGKLIDPAALHLIHERRDDLRRLEAGELELLFRSALAAGAEVPYWFERACQGGVAAGAIALEGLRSDNFRTRAAAVTALEELGDQFAEALIPALADGYPQVRAAALHALERLRPDGAWRAHLVYECYVPAGEFIMGEGKEAHRVALDAFYIGRYPVTNADYGRYMEDRERAFDVPTGKADHPVVEISWYDARDYAAWAGMRLPTEAEWEKAASWEIERGDRDRDGRKRRYPWGDGFDQNRCNTSESGIRGTTPVGKYSPAGDSPCGCADMAGNVWEWTGSLSRGYPYRAGDGREDPHASGTRVLRGGSWCYIGEWARSAFRYVFMPYDRGSDYGVRLGLSSTSSL